MRTALVLAALSVAACSSPPTTLPDLSWDHEAGRSVTLRHGDRVLWSFLHDPAAPHAYFHPLALPGTGPLTVDAPVDHVWHHGLWFCWKFIDDVNYWEHPRGADRPVGRTRFALESLDTADDGSATVRARVGYAPSDDADPVLTEERTIEVSAPTADGSYVIDWTGAFTARAEKVVLDRTPLPGEPGGKVYGGYSGLSLRMVNLADRAVVTIDGPQEFNQQHRLRTRADGLEYGGELDGVPVGIAILAHPANVNAPSPWYAIRSPAMTFFTPAVICHGPLTLEEGEQITLRYRIVVHPGHWDADRLALELRRLVGEDAANNMSDCDWQEVRWL